MTELYVIALQLCIQTLIPNPHTVMNLPEHQQEYIIKAVTEECRKETEAKRLIMCVEKGFKPEECL